MIYKFEKFLEMKTTKYDLVDKGLTSLKFLKLLKTVKGDFDCSKNQISSLDGCPETIEGDFNCSNNNLTSLVGAPKIVEGVFNCSNNNLTKKDIDWLKENCKIKGEIIWK